MLSNQSEQLRHCYERAENCARKAAGHRDPEIKQDYLDLERRWLLLARSYELSERLTDFSKEARRRARDRFKPGKEQTSDGPAMISDPPEPIGTITPFLQKKAFDPELVDAMSDAFVSVCTRLGLANRPDPTVLVAKKVIELAQRGFKDSSAIQLMALRELGFDSV
jgi:hypothetical protein